MKKRPAAAITNERSFYKMIELTIKQAAIMIAANKDILVLMHRSPDGDTVGCAYALCYALRKLGKRAQPVCSDAMPKTFSYITNGMEKQSFEPKFIISTDVATTNLLGDGLEQYKDRIDLCIDHHPSNTGFAEYGVVDGNAGACALIIADLIKEMGVEPDTDIANAIFTGVATDTGCFAFSNASAEIHRVAAEMIEAGAESAMITRRIFETKSRSRLELEKMVLGSLRYFHDGKIALVTVTAEMMSLSGAAESETEGIASIPRQIEGVMIGITVREKGSGNYRISVRTSDGADASRICASFGGGGHKAAAGCTIEGDLESVIYSISSAAISELLKLQ